MTQQFGILSPHRIGASLLGALLLMACSEDAAPTNNGAATGGSAGAASVGASGGVGGSGVGGASGLGGTGSMGGAGGTEIPEAGSAGSGGQETPADAGPMPCDPSEFAVPTCRFCDPEDPNSCSVCADDATCDAPTYQDNGDGTVTSSCCGLVWQQTAAEPGVAAMDIPTCNDNEPPAGCMTWTEASAHCASLPLAGGGWRLPWVRELKTLAWSAKERLIDLQTFPDYTGDWYWTQSAYGENHWMVDMNLVYATYVGDKSLRVRCVR